MSITGRRTETLWPTRWARIQAWAKYWLTCKWTWTSKNFTGPTSICWLAQHPAHISATPLNPCLDLLAQATAHANLLL
jgi:hypothetical protein